MADHSAAHWADKKVDQSAGHLVDHWADLMVDSIKAEATYEMSLPSAATEPVLEEAETHVDDESGIEQQILTIIEMKQAGE